MLNAAITLRGAYPVVAEAAWLDEPKLVLESKDIGMRVEPQQVGEVLDYANPGRSICPVEGGAGGVWVSSLLTANPETPIKNLLRSLGAGIWLNTQSNAPRGSGLGTSSILAGAVFAGVAQTAGPTPDDERRTFVNRQSKIVTSV